jgi:rhodanese-related sulfurtransferase
MTRVQPISVPDAARLMKKGARLIDIRSPDEHARENIPAATCNPLDSLAPVAGDGPVIFHCRSGNRTAANAERLGAVYQGEAYVLEGGIEGWKSAGFPVRKDRRQALEIMRQVQIAGGTMILLSVMLTLLVAPVWALLAGAVGVGMLHAGLTGSCAMTRLLEPMPWNRPKHA